MFKKIALGFLGFLAFLVALVLVMGMGWFGDSSDGVAEVQGPARPASVNAARDQIQAQSNPAADKQILFGDFHVHTTLSFDAYLMNLPLTGGEGAHSPADACDYARYCSQLDFWSINDHAEALTQEHWSDMKRTIRECNARAGDLENPDLVSFLGWEWTQMGSTPENHFGHRNIVLRDTADDDVPARPVGAKGNGFILNQGAVGLLGRGAAAIVMGERGRDLSAYLASINGTPVCGEGERGDDPECIELTATTGELFDKLNDWGGEAVVIPHGTAWGTAMPMGSDYGRQLTRRDHDPKWQRFVEVYSGHGSSEVHRDWREIELDAFGDASCPEPTEGYLPSCWRAGELIKARCLAAGDSAEECEDRARQTRAMAAQAGVKGHTVVEGAQITDWLNSGQCTDCQRPAFNYRPTGSAQYMLALGNFDQLDESGKPLRYRLGFLGSSDNHAARPGNGFKQINRFANTESKSGASGPLARLMAGGGGRQGRAQRADLSAFPIAPARGRATETERLGSFFYTGGLVAVHSTGRNRDAIWNAVDRKEVYGTSGRRMLLWFDLLNGPDGKAVMGSEVEMASAPTFEVRALGSFEQKPGCPDFATDAMGADALQKLCRGECYNPSEQRRAIDRIEIIRIRPQIEEGEDVRDLIDDPWKTIDCAQENPNAGCSARVTDPEFAVLGRETVYYARAVETPDQAINGQHLQCTYDAEGTCVAVQPCADASDCLGETEPQAEELSLDAIKAQLEQKFSDPKAARKAGYEAPQGPRGAAGNPLRGRTLRHAANGGDNEINPLEPENLIYAEGPAGYQLVGAIYASVQPADAATPTGIAGDEGAWTHMARPEGEGRGGPFAGRQQQLPENWPGMASLTVWFVPNPDGRFGQKNLYLPFMKAGIDPAASTVLGSFENRKLLGEGAMAAIVAGESWRLFERIKTEGKRSQQRKLTRFAKAVRTETLPALKAAVAAGDEAGQEKQLKQLSAQWQAMYEIYSDIVDGSPMEKLFHRLVGAMAA
ncbi:unnamed protein product [Symbiodinium microadriaticum]|nr:unnamed protein product [Symbiodinium microadriaticum]